MTSSEQQGTPPLTRKQLRELRETGANPVIEETVAPAAVPSVPATPVAVPDLGSLFAPRQTASPAAGSAPTTPTGSPVVGGSLDSLFAPRPAPVEPAPPASPAVPAFDRESPASAASPVEPVQQAAAASRSDVAPPAPPTDDAPAAAPDSARVQTLSRRELRELLAQREQQGRPAEVHVETPVEPGEEPDAAASADAASHAASHWIGELRDQAPVQDQQPAAAEAPESVAETPQVSPSLGRKVLESETRPEREHRDFDEVLSAPDTTGSQHVAPMALIFNQTPGPLTLGAPLSSDGGVMVTGTLELPSTVGSHGHAPGATDGRDVDAVLLDSELEASSSPAPVAASSAIGTIKPAGEVMRQPAPEKGGKLLMWLAITAGVLMITLSGAVIFAFASGVF